jgi:hypothetical protein
VTEVVAVEDGEGGRPAVSDLYRFDPAQGRGRFLTPPQWVTPVAMGAGTDPGTT